MRAALAASLCVLVSLAASRAAAIDASGPPAPARFAVIVGVNEGVDKDAAPLRYADDDAADFLDLFRGLGARAYLLSRLDDNTRRLHQQAAAEAQEPRLAGLRAALRQVRNDVATARERHVPTTLYFVYAGHGNVENGRGYVALEDGRLFAADLERLVVDQVGADETHFIVDACYSVFLATGRGPGGEREEAHGFSSMGGLAARSNVGLLLSTSSARESHEWSEYQAGVFSHEVRSGLLGAADVDRDGLVSYREIAAFIERANAPVPNERFRPDVFVKEPAGPSHTLVDLRPGLGTRLELDGANPGHYLLEDTRGVRLADFHNAAGQSLRIIRLLGAGPLFLRRVGEAREYVVATTPSVLRLRDLSAQVAPEQARGAAHASFQLLFTLPFSQEVVERYDLRAVSDGAQRTKRASARRAVAIGLFATGAVAAAGGTWALASAASETADNQSQVAQTNRDIDRDNRIATVLFVAGGAAIAAGVTLLLWPKSPARSEPSSMTVTAIVGPGAVGLGGRF